jgi:hypothetical protein
MPIPSGFDNMVRLVTGAPISATEINAELATQNAAKYWMTSLEFIDANNAVLLFGRMAEVYGFTALQKVNLVAATQLAIDADKATEIAGGYWPTGLFITPGGLLILYQLLDESVLP